MAVRRQDLELASHEGARIYRFPSEAFAARRGRARAAARRRRVTGAAAVVLAVGLLIASGPGGAAEAGSERILPRSVVVQPGETLWDIARRYAPEGTDPRAFVDSLAALNGGEAGVVAGQRLRLRR
jgi:nucleoid-associated protein YgaU